MAYVEFDGELDGAEVSGSGNGFIPFDGELDKPQSLIGRAADYVSETADEISKGFQTGVTGAKQMFTANKTLPEISKLRLFSDLTSTYDKIDAGERVNTLGSDYTTSQARMYANSSPEIREKLRAKAASTMQSSKEEIGLLVDQWNKYQSEMRKTQGRVANFTDVQDVKGFNDWLSFNVGQGVPYLGASALSAVLGGVVAGPAGATAGAVGSGYAMGIGDIQGELIDKGITDRPDIALAGGVPYAALDMLGPAGQVAKGFGKQAIKGGIKEVAKVAAKQGAEEFVNEAGQEVVKDASVSQATGEDVLTKENAKKWFNSGMAGAASGGPMGAATHSMQQTFSKKATVEDIGAASSVDEAIAAATEVVNAPPTSNTEADSLLGATNPYDVGGFISRAQSGEETDIDQPQRGLFGGGGDVAIPELVMAQAAEMGPEVAPPELTDTIKRGATRDELFAQRQAELQAREEVLREHGLNQLAESGRDQQVEQANALTSAQGFDTAEPTAMQLAMQKAQERRKLLTTPVSKRPTSEDQESIQKGQIEVAAKGIPQTTKNEPTKETSRSFVGSPYQANSSQKLSAGIDLPQSYTTQPAQPVQSSASLASPVSRDYAPFSAPSQPIAKPEVTQSVPATQAAATIPQQTNISDRRQDLARRRAVAEMTPDEMRQALLTDELTGLGNRRSYNEVAKKPFQASIDIDSLKWINDNLGHEAGDRLIQSVGTALREEGIEAYHLSGDEFAAQFDDDAGANEIMARVRDRLKGATFTYTAPDGTVITKQGAELSYGLADTYGKADERLKADKSDREAKGERAGRGAEPPGVVRKPAARGGTDRDATAQEDVKQASESDDFEKSGKAVVDAKREGKEKAETLTKELYKEKQRTDRLREITTPVSKRNQKQDEKQATSKNENQGKSDDSDVVLLHSGLSPIEAVKNIGKKLDEATKTKIPEWLEKLPKETQEAARKAGIYVEKKPFSERLTAIRNNSVKEIQQGLLDQFAPLKELGEREYVLARLTKSSDAPLEALLMYGKPFLNDAGAVDVKLEKGGLIGSLQQLQGEHDRFFAWIAGNRAAKLKESGRENLFTDSDISALKDLKNGQMPDGKSRAMLYEKVRLEFNAYSHSVLDIAEKSGIINGPDRAIWESDFYVPFYRVMEDQQFSGPKNVSGMVNQYAFKKLKGGTENLNDLMQNTLRNWSHLLSASLKNQAATAAINTAEKAGIATPIPAKQKGSVTILADGKEEHYMIEDPFIMDAITSLEWAGWNNPAMKWMTKAKHYLTMGVTISPTFKIRNLIRDQISAIGQNQISYNLMSNLAEGWKGTDKESEQYAKMLTGGGLMRFGTFLEDDRAEHMKRLINDGVKANTILDSKAKVKAALEAAWDWWQEAGDRSENITRATIYKQRYEQSIKDGMSDDEAHLMASFAARDSMDFSLQGQWGSIRFLTQLVPFMNARLQGLYKLGRDGIMPSGRMLAPQIFGDQQVGDKAKAMRFGAVTGAVALASIALMMAYRDDDDWKNREEWDRDTYWWFKIGDTAYRIPKPFEIGAIGTIAERGLETVLNGMDKESRKLFMERMGVMLSQTFSMNPVPQLVKPLIDLYANTDSFTGRQIETPGMERLSKSERIGQNTSATAQAIGKGTSLVGLSPVQIDHLVNGYFSWLGTHIVMTTDFAVRPMMGLPEKPARRWPDDYFVLGDFAKDLPANQSKYITKFYEQSKEVQEAMADIRYYQSIGNTVKAAEMKGEYKDKKRLERLYLDANKHMAEINKRIKVTQYKSIDPQKKREEIDRLTQAKIKLARITEERRVSREKASQEQE